MIKSGRGESTQGFTHRIKSIVILTLLPVAPEVAQKPHTDGCFELYGFDILIDENLKSWLLEVNLSPALNVDSQTDIDVKKPLLEDILALMDISDDFGSLARQHYEESLKTRTRRKKSTQSSGDKDAKVKKNAYGKEYPDRCGQLQKIYPFDTLSHNRVEPVKVGSPEMKAIILKLSKNLNSPSTSIMMQERVSS